ncbi:MAG: hypothetical protein E7240_03425 [Lachnospiraceae bacterium]|nr:hypothetical protein [Lachnospiraceae bacterium]
MQILQKKTEVGSEKKVEYLELIYDLIFVYIIGRNNQLLQYIENGFIRSATFYSYILCALAIIQIWNFSTFYINMFGRNSLRDHLSLFVNMYLLYYIGEGTRVHWESFQNQYHTAWALILINIGVQYCIEYRHHLDNEDEKKTIRHMAFVLFGEALLVLAAIPIYNQTGIQTAGAAIAYGLIMNRIFADDAKACMIDFPHLTERAMLYVVFTFGEMIITVAAYFQGELTWNSVYFSLMCFLIVVGLFLSYEVLYDRIIDREKMTTGVNYMMIHLFLIFSMNLITTSLSFMRKEAVSVDAKMIMILLSFLMFFLCLFALQLYAKPELCLHRTFMLPIIGVSAVFAAAMWFLRNNMRVNILLSVIYVFVVFYMIFRFSRSHDCDCGKEHIH